MPDSFSTAAERRLAILAMLAAKGPLTLQQLVAETGSPRSAIERALSCDWFVRVTEDRRGPRFGLSDKGRQKATEVGG